jgi:hypothetical protein
MIFAGFVTLLGIGVAVAAWPRAAMTTESGFSDDAQLMRAFSKLPTGLPVSQLGAAGFDIGKAQRMSKLALIEQFMPKDSVAFDALDPAVQRCYVGPGDCNAYIFAAMGAKAVLLVEGGRVTFKTVVGFSVAGKHKGHMAGLRRRMRVAALD